MSLQRKTYELSVDGYHFRATVSATHRSVDWLDRPNEYLPSGYSSTVYVAAETSRTDGNGTQTPPLPTAEKVRADIRVWLSTLDELDELEDTGDASDTGDIDES